MPSTRSPLTLHTTAFRISRATRKAFSSTFQPLRQHHYTHFDLQYLFLLALFTFCFLIMDQPMWLKAPVAILTVALLIPQKTRRFMLPLFAVVAWLILFYCCRFIPANWRPHIFTSVLPALENILYGGSISEHLAARTSPFKDLLAWMPYGVLHYVLPVVTAILIVFYGPPGTLPVFARTFGYMNVAGVLTQIFFPCAPPWYEARYGSFQPATYSMSGDPGGLARVDDILGTNMYKSTFTASPLVFGAFPSLHSADAWLLAFFLIFSFGPRAIPFAGAYVFWIWWATMYLGHHYVVDLVGGGVYAVIAFWIASFFLPALMLAAGSGSRSGERMDSKAIHLGPVGKRDHDYGQALLPLEKEDLVGGREGHDSVEVDMDMDHSWDLGQDDQEEDKQDVVTHLQDFESSSSNSDEIQVLSRMVIVPVDLTTEAGPSSASSSFSSSSSSQPSSPTSPSFKRKSASTRKNKEHRQSWGGWQGYETWIKVMAKVNSPPSSPTNSPSASPRTSTGHQL